MKAEIIRNAGKSEQTWAYPTNDGRVRISIAGQTFAIILDRADADDLCDTLESTVLFLQRRIDAKN